MRVPQPDNGRGSLKWIQCLAARDPQVLLDAIEPKDGLPRGKFTWLSPLKTDEYAEYRDSDFLERLGHPELTPALKEFWPSRGPQWDGLGRFDDGTAVLIEAKANIPELKSKCAASQRSRVKIDRALAETARALGATVTPAWSDEYYQYANRLAHLHFLKREGVPARLLFLYFVGDSDVAGPEFPADWSPAIAGMYHQLGLTKAIPGLIQAFVPVSKLISG